MSEKDEFTFDDNDHIPETDLSGVFADAEEESRDVISHPDMADDFAGKAEPPEDFRKAKDGKGQKSRMLLLILLLVVAAAGGVYYFAGFGDMAPEPVTLQQASRQVVVVSPPPAKTPAPVVAQAAPQLPPAAEIKAGKGDAAEAAPVATPAAKAAKPGQQTAAKGPAENGSSAQGAVTGKSDQTQPADGALPAPVAQNQKSAAEEAKTSQPAAGPATSAGDYVLDAGAFLFEAQREDLEKKISALGFKPVVSQISASVRLIRLRVGTVSKDQLPALLNDVRKIAPGAFSLAEEGQYVVYAGSFADQQNIESLSERLRQHGLTVVEEPVKVDRNLNRIQFGRFADDASAETAAAKAEQAGIPVRVVKQ